MAIAWSRISSKGITHPPYTNAACRRRRGNGTSRLGACIPHMVDKRKQEVLGEGMHRAGAQSVHGGQRRARRIRWRLGLPWPPAGRVSPSIALRQRPQQRLSLLEVGGIKTLGKPVVHWYKEGMGILGFSLLLPESSETRGGSQLEGLCLLRAGDLKGVMEAALCFDLIVQRLLEQECAFETV